VGNNFATTFYYIFNNIHQYIQQNQNNNIFNIRISKSFHNNYRDIINNICQRIQQITSRRFLPGRARREHRRALAAEGEAGGLGRVQGGRGSLGRR
jgi:hypothetical protein